MRKSEMNSLVAGVKVQSKKDLAVYTIVGIDLEQGKVILDNGKLYTMGTIQRWYSLYEEGIPEVVEPDNTILDDIEQADELTSEQDTTADTEEQEETEQVEELSQDNSENMYRKNLDFKYLGDIILLGHKYSMLSNYNTRTIWFCTVEAHAITISGFGYGGVTLSNGSQVFNLVRSGDELDNEVRILIVKEDYINRFQGKKLKVKIRKAFQELDEAHSADYIQKNCPLIIQPKSFWTDVVLPLKEGKDILPELDFYSSSKGNEQGAFAHIGLAGNELHVLEVNPKILPGDLVNKLRIWGFKDSYMEEGYIININMKQIGDDFIPIFNEVANIVGLNPITDQQQNTQQQEQQEDITANTDTAVNEIHNEQDTTTKNEVVEPTTAINGQEIFENSISGIVIKHGCKLNRMKQYIAVKNNKVRGTLIYIRVAKEGGYHFDIGKTTWNKLDTDTQVDLVEQFDACIKDKTRGLWRISNCDSLDIFEKLLTTALDIAS